VTGLLGLELPVGIDDEEFPLPAELIDRLHASARRALEARRIVVDGTVNEAVASVLELAASPLLVMSVQVEEGVEVDATFLLCDTDLGVEVAEFAQKCYRLTPFVTRDLVTRVIRLTDLRPSTPAGVEGFSLSSADLATAAQLAGQDPLATADLLVSAGVDAPRAAVFAEALATLKRTVAVTAMHRPDEERIEGGALSWLDCGLRGTWWSEPSEDGGDAIESDDEGDVTMRIAPITAEAILRELVSYLPLAFSDEPSPAPDASEPSA
jgi:hypothetical protein